MPKVNFDICIRCQESALSTEELPLQTKLIFHLDCYGGDDVLRERWNREIKSAADEKRKPNSEEHGCSQRIANVELKSFYSVMTTNINPNFFIPQECAFKLEQALFGQAEFT